MVDGGVEFLGQNDHDILIEIRTILVDVRQKAIEAMIMARAVELRVTRIEDANGVELLAWVRDFRSGLKAYIAVGLGASTVLGWLVTLAVHYISK